MEEPAAERLCTIREKVAEAIGANPFRTWFGGSTEFQLERESLKVVVPNPFVGKWISSNYLPQIVTVARDVIGTEPRVEICTCEPATTNPAAPPRNDGQPRPLLPVRVPHEEVPRTSAPRRPEARPRLRGELDTFVVGPSNELAFSVASAVLRAPGDSFKHLVFYSGCGLGKTHLLQGICNGLTRAHPELQWSYLSGEEFTNEFIYSVKTGRVDLFRARFRYVDLLVIDDIHFLANKRATQDEFLHTFNAIDGCGKTVVLSSDCHPRQIATFSESLTGRLLSATIVRIDPPDLLTRREILRRRAATMLIDLPSDVIDYVANHITGNVRELEAALYRLAAFAALTREPLRLDVAKRAVEDCLTSKPPPDAAEIERIVAAHFGVTREALHSSSRDRTVTHARAIAMYLIRKHTRMSFPEIGRLGHKQHSTVLMATRRIQNLLDHNGAVAWRTPTGEREMPVRTVLEEIEQRLVRETERA